MQHLIDGVRVQFPGAVTIDRPPTRAISSSSWAWW